MMITKLSEKIAFYFVREGIIDEADADLYRFGVETIFCSLADVLIVILTGLLFHRSWEAVWYFIVFVNLRKLANGYHARTFGACKLLMTFMMVCVLGITKLPFVQGNICVALAGTVLTGWLARKCYGRLVNFSYCILQFILIYCKPELAVLTMSAYVIVFFASNMQGFESG